MEIDKLVMIRVQPWFGWMTSNRYCLVDIVQEYSEQAPNKKQEDLGKVEVLGN